MPRSTHKDRYFQSSFLKGNVQNNSKFKDSKTKSTGHLPVQNRVKQFQRLQLTTFIVGTWQLRACTFKYSMHEFLPLRNTKLDHNHQACSFHPNDLHPPTARQQGLGSQSMKSPSLAEEMGLRHIGHWRNCW